MIVPKLLITSSFLVSLLLCSCNTSHKKSGEDPAQEKVSDPLFILLPPEKTGITFNNISQEGLNTNILMYEYFYNGGGVAAGDVNGDGLIDLYFSGNTVDNKLYLNKGNMQFEDITAVAGVAGRPGPWKTGVTMADVNGDGMLDIYVCYSGKLRAEKRTNQLFINQGKGKDSLPVFLEQAAQYGLADAAYSTQGYFFDYDKDGDLDMLLLNHNPNSLPVLDEASTKDILAKTDPEIGIKLYNNNNNKFSNVTAISGISSSSLTYGLGAGIADVNGDGWQDMYICNDYTVPDYLYINQHNGTFKDVKQDALGHTTHFGMGNDVSDINNDGLPDIVALDMLPEDNRRQKMLMAPDNYEKFELMLRSGFYYQYMRNMLQLNNGNGTYSEIGQFSGISNTDWSWAPLVTDYDNDGWKDIFITNGFTRDYTNMDFIKYMNDYLQNNSSDIRRENVLNLVRQIPSSEVKNYMFRNSSGITFTDVSKAWGFNTAANSNGAVYADLNNDGALELVVNNVNSVATVYHNQCAKRNNNHHFTVKLTGAGKNTQGLGAKLWIYYNGRQQYAEQMPARGYQSSVSPIIHFGTGAGTVLDSVRVVWLSGKTQLLKTVKADQKVVFEEKNATEKYVIPASPAALFTEVKPPISFQHAANNINDFKRQPLMVNPMSFFGPCLAKADVNNDGLEDVFAGGATGQAGAVFLQQKNGSFNQVPQPAFEADNICEDAAAVFLDANKDGFTDLYVASGGYHSFTINDTRLQDRLYYNDGKGNFTKAGNALPSMPVSKSCVSVADVNGDGYPDMFVGGRVQPGRYPETPESYLLINNGKGTFTDQTEAFAPGLKKAGMVTAASWTDINGDQQPDLIVTGEWMPITIYLNQKGKLQDKTADYFDQSLYGWWNTLLVQDVTGDGKPDIVAGNMGLNTQCRVNDKQPAELFYKDFDDNGSVDPMLSFYIQGKSYPYITRDELLDQMSSMRTRYTSYKDFADQTLGDIFNEDELKDAGHLKANYLATAFWEMGADKKFHLRSLPEAAQYSPVFTITALDYNTDGKQDLLLCGNINKARLRFGKYDANYGVLLKGDGKGGFEYIPQHLSGLALKGDVRSVIQLNKQLLFGINQKEIKAYKMQ